MKKRFLTLMMTGAMLSCFPVMAMAQETETTLESDSEIVEADYSMIDETVYEGTWLSAFDVFDLYPVAISYAPSELSSLEKIVAYYTEQGFEEVGYMYINEIPVVTYSLNDDGIQTAGIVALGDQGGIYNVTLGAAEDDEEFSDIAANIICSFSAAESEEETE